MTIGSETASRLQVARYGGVTARGWQVIGLVLLLAASCLVPFLLSNYRIFQMTLALAYSIAVLGLNVLTGYNGQISLGHGAFYALGAYVTAILMAKFGVAYWLTIPVAGTCPVVGSSSACQLRLEGLYLAYTFALAVATPQLLKYKHLEEWTGGVQGIVIASRTRPSVRR
jgi:branched-chain amino acid transport system permease protein